MRCRTALQREAFFCAAQFVNRPTVRDMTLREAVLKLGKRDLQRAVMSFSQRGPFVEEDALHGPLDDIQCRGRRISGTALAEAASRLMLDPLISVALVSFSPSEYEENPLTVQLSSGDAQEILELANFWCAVDLQGHLELLAGELTSWYALRDWAAAACPNVELGAEALKPLDGHAFVPAAARRIQAQLRILDRLRACIDAAGRRTEEWDELFTNYFSGGDKIPCFTDESETNRIRFREQLTFRNPRTGARDLFCPWHGKIRTGCLRLHFEYPIRVDTERLHVAYIGPKITRG